MITHRSSLNLVNYSEVSNSRLVTVLLNVPYYDLVTWLCDSNGVFDVESKTLDEDISEASLEPWGPEQWTENNLKNINIIAESQLINMWEQLAKSMALAAKGFKQAEVHDHVAQKILTSFVGRKVLLTFSRSNSLFKKLNLENPNIEEWHLPFITKNEWKKNPDIHFWVPVSVFRCSQFGDTALDLSAQKDLGEARLNKNPESAKHIHKYFAGSGFVSQFPNWVSLSELIRNQVKW